VGAIGHVLVVRGASASGRAVLAALTRAGARPSVIDRRTSISGAPAAKVDLRSLPATQRALGDLVAQAGPIEGVVLFASVDRYPAAGSRPGQRWEQALAEELIEVATILRAISSSVAGRPVPLTLIEGPHPKLAGRPVRRSADDVVAALARGLLAELSPGIDVRTVRFVVGQEASLPAEVLATFGHTTEVSRTEDHTVRR
jgi:NAD(P)-dependent dehydrogenase (short-subunit alcohol dehydrogenase family)